MLNCINSAIIKKSVTNIIFSLTAVFIFILAFNSAHSEPIQVPQMGKIERGSFTTSYKNGDIRWKADWTMEQFEENGENKIKLVLNGKGITSPFSEEMAWESISTWKADGEFLPIEAVTTNRDMNGKIIMIDKKTFDRDLRIAVFERLDVKANKTFREQFETASGMLILEGIVVALRSLPFSTQESLTTQLLTNDPELYKVEFKQRGIETIDTPGGKIECYRVELVPKLGLLGVFKVFFPKTYFWFTVKPPHTWVRYEGLENGLGTPEVVMEVYKFETTLN